VSGGRSNACNPLAPQIDKNLGHPVVKRCRSVRLQIVGGYIFYPSTLMRLSFALACVSSEGMCWVKGESPKRLRVFSRQEHVLTTRKAPGFTA
jgi:hypothetical protein